MLRLKPTVISLTAAEVEDAEIRRLFRKHLRRVEERRRQEQERKYIEQNVEILPKEPSSLIGSPSKEESDPAAQQPLPRALANSPPQPRRTPDELTLPAFPVASPHAPDRHTIEEPQAATEHGFSAPRLLAMTPKRLGSTGARRDDVIKGSAIGPSGVLTVPSLLPQPSRDQAHDGREDDAETAHRQGESESPASESASRRLPQPFSRTSPAVVVADNEETPFDTHDGLGSREHNIELRGLPKMPLATPPRQSSVGATPSRQAVDDEQIHAGPSHAVNRGPTRGVSSTWKADSIPNTPSRFNGSGEVEAVDATPSAGMARLRIYNDFLPRFTQPETPGNLPEARHQSRLHGSYTVPARRDSPVHFATPRTSRRWRLRSGRSRSPAGLQTPGFLGLYGGLENSDDTALFEQADRIREAWAEHGSSS